MNEIVEVFNNGVKILILLTSVFFLVFFYLCSLWSASAHPERRFKIGALVSGIYTFMFFLAGFILISLISFLWVPVERLINLFEMSRF